MFMRNSVLNVEYLGQTRRKCSRSSMTFMVHCLQSLNSFGVPLHLPRSINQSINQYLFTTISRTLHNYMYIYILTQSNKSMIQIQYNMEMLPGVA